MLISKQTNSIDQSINWREMGLNAHAGVVTGRELYLQNVPEMEKFIVSEFKKRKSKSIVKVLDLLKLSIKIYREESSMNGVMNLSHFSTSLRKINL